MNLHFLGPSLLVGLLAAVLPTWLHRIGRKRARPFPFPAMELLLGADRQVAARRRLREVLLLVTRTLLAAAIPLAIARPFAWVRSEIPQTSALPQTAVVLIDDSASMSRSPGLAQSPLFERARTQALRLVSSFAPESEVALVLASEGTTTPLAELSNDRNRAIAALSTAHGSFRRADFRSALARAAQIADTGGQRDRHIYLFTDLQRSGWEEVDPTTAARDVPVNMADVSNGALWENHAVVDLVTEPTPDSGVGGVATTAEIANYAATPVQGLGLTFRLDDEDIARTTVDVPAGGRVRKRILHPLPPGRGHVIQAMLDKDRFPADDSRLARLDVARGIKVLLVNGDPRTVRNEDEVFFVEAALRASGSLFTPEILAPDDLARRPLGDVNAVVLANVGALPEEGARKLVAFVQGGGGLLIGVGDHVDPEVTNRQLGAILPQPFGAPRTASAQPGAGREGETIDERPAERLLPISLDRRHALLTNLPDGEGLTSSRFFRYLLLQPTAEGAERAVVLRYESGAPALIEGEAGRGRVLVLTTSLDREWTDLPIRPGFLPLMQEAMRYLAGAPSSDARASLLVGQRRSLPVTADEKRLEIRSPSGQVYVLTPDAPPPGKHAVREGDRTPRLVPFDRTDEPGTYRVRGVHEDGSVVERPGDTFVVNLDPRESDPARLAPDKRPDAASRGPGGAPGAVRRFELWHVIGAILVGLLVAESLLSVRWPRRWPRPTELWLKLVAPRAPGGSP